jgi:hypothetical protein
MKVLLKNQEPRKFILELCMVTLEGVEEQTMLTLKQIFVDILRERQQTA